VFETLVVAVDSSAESDRAVELARDLALLASGSVQLVHVVEHVLAAGRAGGFDVEDRDDVSQSLAREEALLKEAGVEHSVSITHAPVGHVAREIVAAAEESKADVIVMGSRGLSGVGAALLGSTAYKVLHLANRPVLVAR
jgi:nucleotide-binding universal stress UspA family protein